MSGPHECGPDCQTEPAELEQRMAAVEQMPPGPERHAALGELLARTGKLMRHYGRTHPPITIHYQGPPGSEVEMIAAAARQGVTLRPVTFAVEFTEPPRRFGGPRTLPTAEAANHVLAYFEGLLVPELAVPPTPAGDFFSALIGAMKRADPDNLQRFRASFPDHAIAVELYQRTDGGRDQLVQIVQAAR